MTIPECTKCALLEYQRTVKLLTNVYCDVGEYFTFVYSDTYVFSLANTHKSLYVCTPLRSYDMQKYHEAEIALLQSTDIIGSSKTKSKSKPKEVPNGAAGYELLGRICQYVYVNTRMYQVCVVYYVVAVCSSCTCGHFDTDGFRK